jgi:hypothetical protein
MSKNLFDKLSPTAAFAAQLFAAADLDLAEMTAKGDANALKSHLEKTGTSVELKAAIDAAVASVQGELLAANSQVTALSTQVANFTGALATAKVVLKASDEKAGAEIAAAQGVPPVETRPAPSASSTKPDAGLTGLARVEAALKKSAK